MVAVALIASYGIFVILMCALGGWEGEESFMASLPDDQKPGNIKTVDVPPTPVEEVFIYAQDRLSRKLFGVNVNDFHG